MERELELELSAERMARLYARYDLWGLDRVRAELARDNRDEFVTPEVTEYALAWVAAAEKALRRKKLRAAALTFAGVLLIGAGLGAVIKV